MASLRESTLGDSNYWSQLSDDLEDDMGNHTMDEKVDDIYIPNQSYNSSVCQDRRCPYCHNISEVPQTPLR